MRINSLNNNYAIKKCNNKIPCFTSLPTETIHGVVASAVNKFAERVEKDVPTYSIFGFNPIKEGIQGLENLTSYSAYLELKLPTKQNPEAKGQIKRLTLSVLDPKKPAHNVTCLLKAGTKEDIINYLRHKNTPDSIKKMIDEGTYTLENDFET